MSAALPITAMLTTDRTTTAAVIRRPNALPRREYHRPYHATIPVVYMKISPSNAVR